MIFDKFILGKTLSLANFLSLTDMKMAKNVLKNDFKYISCLQDPVFGSENLIRCEIGSINYVLALLCKYTLDLNDEYFHALDDGYLSGECNVGEEEFEELSEWLKDVKNIIIDDSFITHPDNKLIFEFLNLLKTNLSLNVVMVGSDAISVKTDGKLSKLIEPMSFDGSVIYTYLGQVYDELVGGVQFSIVAKLKDGDYVELDALDFKLKRKFRLDINLKGTVALASVSSLDGYNFKLVKVSKVNAD
ncbi:hypothetical protein KDD93_01385 [Campylobacter sp. faydin G-24]|uniref:Uncharacterized protein n=1 Tax=Campylobacter anatolicus TaxID=2829105 RepID=A0ABS5HGI5_9BACT|nr:hypothetical protein [Campylobacter anatolicus]MBR8463228.1 hypothetical protein [Campylobacter anatolicus]